MLTSPLRKPHLLLPLPQAIEDKAMTRIPAYRTHLTMQELLVRWDWTENDLRDAIVRQDLIPSYFISGAVWPRVANDSGKRTRSEATSLQELLYLVSFRERGALDGYFDFGARTPDALTTGEVIFEVGGVGVQNGRISLQEVLTGGVVTEIEMQRFEEETQLTPQPEAAVNTQRWPWGNHHTESLGHLEAAANRFWVNYDPADPSTAETNETVSSWLQTEHQLSKNKADAIASMLRPDDLPTGPRR